MSFGNKLLILEISLIVLDQCSCGVERVERGGRTSLPSYARDAVCIFNSFPATQGKIQEK